MKITYLLVILFLMIVSCAFSQAVEPPLTGFENVQVSQATQDLEIQIKAMMPDISVVQIKSDTYIEPGNYKYTIDLKSIQDESNTQLTNWQQEIKKWLEESK